MAYVFSGNPNAQSYPQTHHAQEQDSLQDEIHSPTRDSDTNRARDHYRYQDGDDYPTHDPISTRRDSNNNMTAEKEEYYGGAKGNIIWARDDKRAFANRSGPVKVLRIVFCVLIIAVVFILSIISLTVMFARPPNVAISGVGVPSQDGVQYSNGAFSFNVSVDITISNPNTIEATLKTLSATAFDATDKSAKMGYGKVKDIHIKPQANTTIDFPFQIKYDQKQDPNLSVLSNIASKCGLSLSGLTSGSTSSNGNLDFDLDIHVDISVLSISIPINFSHNVSFACPLSASSLQGAFGGLLSGLTGRDLDEDEALLAKRSMRPVGTKAQLETCNYSPMDLVVAAADNLVKQYAGRTRESQKLLHDAL